MALVGFDGIRQGISRALVSRALQTRSIIVSAASTASDYPLVKQGPTSNRNKDEATKEIDTNLDWQTLPRGFCQFA
jgi:hypothetical protein